ncbi:hypothetical protein GCM10009554_20900 [Kribbella koreensis]|uniref:Sugar ABC transporter ATPase n=2 Tax=Kribbella koreensis TaxID=57909 RepID=A0ABN1PXC7_9ACTN
MPAGGGLATAHVATTRGKHMTDPVDTSDSTDVLDEETLTPLAEAPGIMADDPELDDPATEAAFQDPIPDTDPLGPDEEPGVEPSLDFGIEVG